MSSHTDEVISYYLYKPSHVLPAVFAAIVGISMLLHVFQNLYVFHCPEPLINTYRLVNAVTTDSGESPSLSHGVESFSQQAGL